MVPVHSWLALPIWFFVLIVCFTGMLAVVSQEIVWLANPDVRASKPDADAERLSFQQVLDALHKAEPDMVVDSLIQPDGSHFALTADVTFPDGTSPTLYVNPYTGAIQGKSPDFNFEAFTRALHGWWLVPFTNGFSWGWYLVSILGLPMLASLVTGLVVYKKFWKASSNRYARGMVRASSGATCIAWRASGRSGSSRSFPSPVPGS